MPHKNARRTTVATLLGQPVYGNSGDVSGRIAEFLLHGPRSTTHVTELVLTANGRFRGSRTTVPVSRLSFHADGSIHVRDAEELPAFAADAATVFLERDLLDQQIIDVSGRKVVRVNDVDLVWEAEDESICDLRIAEVEVGLRGAMRRLLKGLPNAAVQTIAERFQSRSIPWEFVDLIDRDPARRVRLKIEGDRLSSMHPSDIADILEELAPAERDAVFTSLDEEIAAEALEEVEPKLQRSLLEHMESSRVADIVEEMDPAAAADLLAELSEERSDAILQQMEPEERQEVEELLEFPEDVAAGRMTTDYVAVAQAARVADAIEAMRAFEGDVDTLTEVFLIDDENHLRGVVNLARILLAGGDTPLSELQEARIHCCNVEATGKQIAEQFDKYNLRSLAVLDQDNRLEGVIYAEHVIALLREGR